jgi:hypothetical protein
MMSVWGLLAEILQQPAPDVVGPLRTPFHVVGPGPACPRPVPRLHHSG